MDAEGIQVALTEANYIRQLWRTGHLSRVAASCESVGASAPLSPSQDLLFN